ncbi:hypothetical protein Tco_0576067 [Tanacetum coccineum]
MLKNNNVMIKLNYQTFSVTPYKKLRDLSSQQYCELQICFLLINLKNSGIFDGKKITSQLKFVKSNEDQFKQDKLQSSPEMSNQENSFISLTDPSLGQSVDKNPIGKNAKFMLAGRGIDFEGIMLQFARLEGKSRFLVYRLSKGTNGIKQAPDHGMINCSNILILKRTASVTRTASTTVKPCQEDSLNLPDHRIHKDGDDDALFQLKTDSLPHAHDIKSYQVKWFSRGFQDDAKSEHEGQDTRRKVGKMRSRRKDKDLKILRTKKTKIKDNDKG